MKNRKLVLGLSVLGLLAICLGAANLWAQGMPAEQKEMIHGLFDSHAKIERKVVETKDGYRSITTSEDPKVAEMLQKHVRQMEERMMDGRMVRGWDPAYVEFVGHYGDVTIDVENLKNGVSVVAVGRTEDAIKVLRNHAQIVSKFVEKGWAEHDIAHPAVASGGYSGSASGLGAGPGGCSAGEGGSCGVEGGTACMSMGKNGGEDTARACCLTKGN